jgi:hypothetical protein
VKITPLPFFFTLLSFVVSCSQEGGSRPAPAFELLSTQTDRLHSTEMGNFAATAVKEAYELDFVFLPAKYYANRQQMVEVKPGMTDPEIAEVLKHFPINPQDQLLIGSMSGEDIKQFVIERSEESYNLDLETAGLWYDVIFNGGVVESARMTIQGRRPVADDQTYRIAISDDFFFGSAFPGYKFRNNFNFKFSRQRLEGSIHWAVNQYLKTARAPFPNWSDIRGRVENVVKNPLGFRTIPQIQGRGHTSPYRAHPVVTRGIVTAVGTDNWYPYDLDIYIQTETPDGDPLTSEGLHISSEFNSVDIQLGQLIEVRGVVMEEMRNNGMGETTLRLTQAPQVISEGHPLPAAYPLVNVPTERISTFDGLLMHKEVLNLNDGIDFWESLEGMRVQAQNLVISGFRGGGEELLPVSNRFYLNLYVYPKNSFSEHLLSHSQGLMPDLLGQDMNPELFVITTNHLSKGISVERDRDEYFMYNIGDEIGHSGLAAEHQKVEGVMTYPKNIFGGGEYALVFPEPQEAMKFDNIRSPLVPWEEYQQVLESMGANSPVPNRFIPFEYRPRTSFDSASIENELTIATFNLKNLAGNRQDRIDMLGVVNSVNLKCPDLFNLVEVQDDNGFSLRSGPSADITLRRIKIAMQQHCPDTHYEFINVDPFEQSEGGQPGGNIRISVMYNKEKLGFDYRGTFNPLDGGHTGVLPGGYLSLNPGRVFPLHSAFNGSRRSPVMEFYRLADPNDRLYIIGAHLNSKLGDTDFWGSLQPVVQFSDDKRALMTQQINQFVRWIEAQNSRAHIVVLGDFNALIEESSMKVLMGTDGLLRNGMDYIPQNQRYTTNHNGNSQALDYVFMNRNLYNKECTDVEVLHLNSDYMGRISDHDPVILKTCF